MPASAACLADLDTTLNQAIDGKPARALLSRLAEKWDTRIDKLGRADQVNHLRQSLGLAPISPSP